MAPAHLGCRRIASSTPVSRGVAGDVLRARRAAFGTRLGVFLPPQSDTGASSAAGASSLRQYAFRVEPPVHGGHVARRPGHLPSALLVRASTTALEPGGGGGVLPHPGRGMVLGPVPLPTGQT